MKIRLSFIMLIPILFSCSKEREIDNKQNLPALNISTSAQGDGKILTSFGVYALSDGKYIYNNSEFTLTGDVYNSVERIDFQEGVNSLDIYAYWPYIDTDIDIEQQELGFEINSDQTSLANFEASDILWAHQTTSDFYAPVDVKFGHTLSQLEIRLVEKSKDKTVTRLIDSNIGVKLVAQPTKVTVNLSSGIIGTGSENKEIEMYVNLKSAEGDAVQGIYCNLVPTQFKASEHICDLNIGDMQYSIYSTTDITMVQGQRTVINISIDGDDAQIVSNFNVSDWISADEVNADMDSDTGVVTSVKDVEGNSYPILQFGDNYWMAQNLRTTKYNDGADIEYINTTEAWKVLTSGAFCISYHAAPASDLNHFLYNHFAVETEKLCPQGWIVPSKDQWYELADQLGGVTVAGKALKSLTGWLTGTGGVDGNGTNSSGMNILPVGVVEVKGPNFTGKFSYLWTTTPHATTVGNYHAVYLGNSSDAIKNWAFAAKNINGYSVRCIKPVN